MKSVLLPIDGSPCALRAVELILAKRARYSHPEEMAIHLVNVQLPFTVEDIRWASKEQVNEYYQGRSERETREACALLDRAGVGYTRHDLVGEAAEEIATLAADVDRTAKKLANADFVARAPEEVVEENRERMAEAQAAKAKLEAALQRLSGVG